MDKARGRHIGFLCSRLADPRSIQLREGAFLAAHRRRGTLHDITEISHDLAKIRRSQSQHILDSLSLFQDHHMFPVQFNQDREYPLCPTVLLPQPLVPNRSFADVLQARRSCRDFGESPLDLPDLSFLLSCALGETDRATASGDDEQLPVAISLRSIPSGGALHPTRIFSAVLKGGDLALGIYHFDVSGRSLEMVRSLTKPDIQTLYAAFPIHPQVIDLERAAAVFFISSKFWRSRAKYGPRGYRYCLQEAGAACQNLALAATALGLPHVVLGGFYDDDVHAFLGIDGVDHAVITSVAVGTPPPRGDVD